MRWLLVLMVAVYLSGSSSCGNHVISVWNVYTNSLSSCPFEIVEDENPDRIPSKINKVVCAGPKGKRGHRRCPWSKRVAGSCRTIINYITVYYNNTNTYRNESFPVACTCIKRKAKEAKDPNFPPSR